MQRHKGYLLVISIWFLTILTFRGVWGHNSHVKRAPTNTAYLDEPEDYFKGAGHAALPIPKSILLFARLTRETLQQKALQNRSHHRFVLIFNTATSGNVHVDNFVLPLEPGQALLVHPYQFHHFTDLSSTTLRWLFCTFELDPADFLNPLRNRVLDPRNGPREGLNVLLREWSRCRRTDGSNELQEAQLQAALLYLLTSLREDLHAQAPDLPPEPEESLLRTINRLMSEAHGAPVVVPDLASRMGISASWLRAEFKRATGVPLGSYIRNYRLNRAMALLRTTDLQVAEIADEAGFGSPQAFSRIFKQKTGIPPRAYRQLAEHG